MTKDKREILFFVKGQPRPVTLSDSDLDQSVEEIKKSLEKCFNSSNIISVTSENNILLIRPSDIQAILITEGERDIKKVTRKSDNSESIYSKELKE